MKKDLQKNSRNLEVKDTIQDSTLAMCHGVQPELYMCCMGMSLRATQRVAFQFMQIHMSLSREFILPKQIRFNFLLKI